jgi:hypothetical protein
MDTRFWGPSGWQLFHLTKSKKLYDQIKDILPCKFCRESSGEFVKKLDGGLSAERWMYELHNMVNHKLRTQCADNPEVINPGPDPSFEEVREKYDKLLTKNPREIPGRDFLFSIAVNFQTSLKDTSPAEVVVKWETQKKFIETLAEVYPFEKFRMRFKRYLDKHTLDSVAMRRYPQWMYGLLRAIGNGRGLLSYSGYIQRTMYYKSGCGTAKSYRGKTCRNGTKVRNNRRTHRISHAGLL